jgi:hypothetical protein
MWVTLCFRLPVHVWLAGRAPTAELPPPFPLPSPSPASAAWALLAHFHSANAPTAAVSRASCFGYGGFCNVGGGKGKPIVLSRKVLLSLSIL